LNKSEVIERVAGAAEVNKQQAERVLDEFFDTVRSEVGRNEKVSWPGFGSFSATARTARTGRNPQTGAPVKIPASRAVKFSAGSALKEHMKNSGTAKKSGAAKKKAAAPTAKATAAKKAPAKKATAAKKAPAAKATAAKKPPAKKSAATSKKR